MTRQPVRDGDGNRYLLLKRSSESSLVRDAETGERRHLPNDELEVVEGTTPAEFVLTDVPESLRTLLTAVHDERSLALLVELDTAGPLAVRTLLSTYDFCESDLHGLLAELRAAGLVAETTVAGERGYETTAVATDAVERITD
ncbi:MAG: DUF7346 family protein [Natrialbaceae archaeon]